MDIGSITGGIPIGKDQTGNFRLTFVGQPLKLSVRTPDQRWVVLENNQLLDVTGLTLDSSGEFVYRIPVRQVAAGDLVITSETPFDVLFVQEVTTSGHLKGLDLRTNEVVEYAPPANIFNIRFFVKVISLLSGFGDTDSNSLLPLLLLLGGQGTANDTLTTLLLFQSFGGGGGGQTNLQNLLPLLLLGKGGSSSSLVETLLLAGAFRGEGNLLGSLMGAQYGGAVPPSPPSQKPPKPSTSQT